MPKFKAIQSAVKRSPVTDNSLVDKVAFEIFGNTSVISSGNETMKSILLFSFLLSLAMLANASTTSEYRFEKAELIKKYKPVYPKADLYKGHESWVILSLIVDKEGNASQPIVIDSIGGASFEKAAVRAAKNFKYNPAQLNGEAIQSSDNKVKVSFAISKSGRPGATRRFFKRYKTARKLLLDKKLKGFEAQIDELGKVYTKNFYDYSWLWLLKSNYYLQTNNKPMYLEAMTRSLAYDSKHLPDKVYDATLINLYSEQIHQGKIVAALSTAKSMQERGKDPKVFEEMLKHRDGVITHLNSADTLMTQGKLDDAGKHWVHELYHNKFFFELSEGKLSELEIRCSKKIRRFSIDDIDQTWEIPKKWGQCSIFVSGQADSQFKLYEQR